MITVVLRGDIAKATGQRELALEADSVRDVLAQIKAQYGTAIYKTAKRQLIAVNGLAVAQIRGYATTLQDGDIVKMFPLCGGG